MCPIDEFDASRHVGDLPEPDRTQEEGRRAAAGLPGSPTTAGAGRPTAGLSARDPRGFHGTSLDLPPAEGITPPLEHRCRPTPPTER
ncbi:hypothetical protein JQS43_10045 [Natronosporangium hydrolyticum]|uniref:Uncharacterized protein n=1 Tax=Natronosporangium hydrolyticum TaxID=2811111 RepID=A0A895YRD4_9ACTN|nr:hypothetical protein [Natronosporangium hydrolyticum]QSB16578.1 hypothetical protein JQS43_10045 [Natronosporangium hydrolyticum]